MNSRERMLAGLNALHLEVPDVVARDVTARVMAYVDDLTAALKEIAIEAASGDATEEAMERSLAEIGKRARNALAESSPPIGTPTGEK